MGKSLFFHVFCRIKVINVLLDTIRVAVVLQEMNGIFCWTSILLTLVCIRICMDIGYVGLCVYVQKMLQLPWYSEH